VGKVRTEGADGEPTSWGTTAFISSIAAVVRVLFLGRIGLVGDEDVSLLAARAIADSGLPVLPSGYSYWRAPLFHYLQAPLIALGDIGWLRLTSVAAAAITAALIVRLGSAWVGRRAAIVAGLLYALSLPEIDLARQMRFYALYQLLAFLAIAAMVRCWQEWRSRSAGSAAAWIAAAMMAHELGATLAVGFLPSAIRARRMALRVFCVAVVIVFALLSVGQQRWVRGAMTGFNPSAEQVFGPEGRSVPDQPVRSSVDREASIGSGAAGRVLAGGLVLAGLIVGIGAGRHVSRVPKIVAAGAIGAPAVLAGMGRVGSAFVLLAALAIVRSTIWDTAAGRRVLLTASAFVSVCGIAWLVAELGGGSSLRGAVLHVAGPSVKYAYYTLGWPVVVAVPLALALAYLAIFERPAADSALRFLASMVLMTVVVRSASTDQVDLRYSADVWPFAELIAAWGLVTFWSWVRGAAATPSLRRAIGATVVTVGAVCVALLPGTNVADTFHYVTRQPGDRGPRQISPPFAPDIEGAVAWLRPQLAEGDRVAATDWLTSYCYLGRLDYWIRSGGYRGQSTIREGIVRDVYLGAEVVPTLEALLAKAEQGRVWVIVGGLELEVHDSKLSPDLRSWLAAREPRYRGSDGVTKVILLGDGGKLVEGVGR